MRYHKHGDQKAREQAIQEQLPLVEFLARKFAGRGEPVEDLVQVASVGLIKAVDRFDVDRNIEFSTYATPNILGEIKRYFRDKGWAMRVPRGLQELRQSAKEAIRDETVKTGRSPTIQELADDPRLGRGERRRGPDPRPGLQHREPRRPREPGRARGRHHHGPAGRRELSR